MEPQIRILNASQELFYKYGIRSVTMDDIARHLAMSKKTIYQHFRDKNEIINRLTGMDLQGHRERFDKIKLSAPNAIEEIISIMKIMEEIFSKMNPNVFYDLQKYHTEAWQLFKKFKFNYLLGCVEENINRGIAEGIYRKDLDISIIAKMRIELVELVFNPEAFPPDKYNITKVHLALLDHFLHGIVTLKGHKIINRIKQVTEEE